MPLTQVSSRLIEDTLRYVLGANGSSDYTFTGPGLSGAVNDPTLTLSRGHTYVFENRNSSGAHPFYIKTSIANGGTNDAYNTGVTNNGGAGGTEIVFTVPHDAPDTLYYQCSSHSSMAGQLNIAGSVADGSITTAKLAADAVDGTKIADDAINSEHLVADSIDAEHYAAGSVDTTAIADDAVTADKLANSINTAIAANTAKDLTALSASNLTSGTVPDARFPATLPAASGANLTNLPANRVSRNVVVNGAMRVAQRGLSFTNITNTGVIGSVDRMMMVGAGLDELAFAGKQTSDGPDGFSKCFEFDVTTAESALNANDLAYIRYKIEGQDLVSFYNANGTGKNFVISFYVKAYQAGTYQLNIYKPTGTRFISKTYSIASSGVWQRIEIPITGDTNTSGINDNNAAGLNIAWMLVAGTDYTSAGVLPNWGGWPGNSGFAGGHAVNVASSTDNYFRITGIQVELGDTATAFEHLSFHEDYLRCARYYIQADRLPVMSNRYTGYVSCTSRFMPVPMRAIPSLSIDSTISFNSFFYGSGPPTSNNAPYFQNNGNAGQPYGGDNMILNFSGFGPSNVFQTNEFGEVYGTTIRIDAEL